MARILAYLTRFRGTTGFGYGVGVATLLVALAVRMQLDPFLPAGFPFLTFFPAVILTTLIGGLGPGIATAAASGLASWYFFIPPAYSFELTPGGSVALGFYAFVVGVDIAVIHVMNRALERLAEERNRSAALTRQTQTMFSELQHRVSNNLQLVSSLLLIQKAEVADPVARRALEEAGGRLATLGRLHRRLHDPSRDGLDMAGFLRELCDDVFETAGTRGIACRVSATGVDIPQDQLIPLALIVTELVSNALEHGFAGGGPGTVWVDLREDAAGRDLHLTVRDDGAGLPPGFSLDAPASLGLHIVQSLAAQIDGRLSVAGTSGAAFTLTFPR